MSRSYRKPIIKDGKPKRYWKTIRANQKQDLKLGKDIRDMREIVNDYNVCDHWWYVPKISKFWLERYPDTINKAKRK